MIRAILASPFAPMPIVCAVLVYLASEVHHLANCSRGALKKPDQLWTRAQLLTQGSPAPASAPVPEEIAPKTGTLLWSPIPMVVSPSIAAPNEFQRPANAGSPTPPAPIAAATVPFYCPPLARAGLPVKTTAASGVSAAAAVVQSAIWSPDIGAVPDGSVPRSHTVSPAPVPESPMVTEKSNRRAAGPDRILAAATPMSGQEAMTMLSIEVNKTAPKDLSIHCRTCGQLRNVAGTDRVLIIGVVTDDVVSQTGKILIRAGSKVAGIGRTDLDSGRLQSHGKWSIIDGDHELRAPAVMQDEVSGFEGVAGKETSLGPGRGGRYFFLADKTPFVLLLKGQAEMKEVKTLSLE